MKIAVILGTRPEIIKMSPVVGELEKQQANYFIVHTGQHYSYNMDRIFFDQLKLPQARYNLEAGSGTHAGQTAKILTGVEKVLIEERPDVVLVQGDTNTVLAAALAAAKLHIRIGHVEAGLRSYDRTMPEEINRVLADHCSAYLFAPTEKAKAILLQEGIPEEKIFVTGNTIVDAVLQNLELAESQGGTLERLNLKPKAYFLVTLHRQENVDDPARFGSILQALGDLASIYNLPVIYPIHPRSRKMMQQFNLGPQNLPSSPFAINPHCELLPSRSNLPSPSSFPFKHNSSLRGPGDSSEAISPPCSLPFVKGDIEGFSLSPYSSPLMGKESEVRVNKNPNYLTLIDPVDFLEFLSLENNARLILTDSGGVQEESCILGVPCVTLRDNTERPETVDVGANVLAGANPEKILECSMIMLKSGNGWKNPFGDGKAGPRITKILLSLEGRIQPN